MSIITATVKCDWPGCTATIVVGPRAPGELADAGWGDRQPWRDPIWPKWHACPAHTQYSTGNFLEAITEARKGRLREEK